MNISNPNLLKYSFPVMKMDDRPANQYTEKDVRGSAFFIKYKQKIIYCY